MRQLELTPFARAEFEEAYEPITEPVERARRFVVRIMMAHGTAGIRKSRSGFRAKAYGELQTGAQDWPRYPQNLELVISRLEGVVIDHAPAIDVMARNDGGDTLHYVDPPYIPEARSAIASGIYRHEMVPTEHGHLLAFLRGLKGAVVLSGYPSGLYDEALFDWQRVTTEALADGARPRTEVLWLNPACAAALDRARDAGTLFEARDEAGAAA